MHIGYIGLGKMGSNMVARLLEKRYHVVVYDVNYKAIAAMQRAGADGASSVKDLVRQLKYPRTVWLMVPHQFVGGVLDELTPLLRRGDTIIEGGNSPYRDSIKRAKKLQKRGLRFLDVGVSGGPKGARNGACFMVGGERKDYRRYERLFRDLAVKHGYGHMGPSGSGHFVKMVHNGIEYGMMQSIAEGFDLMRRSREYKLDLTEIARVYRYGSVIESRLMDWMHGAFRKFGNDLKPVSKRSQGLGEGKWTVDVAHQLGMADHVIHAALRARTRSKKQPNYQAQVIMALRNMFGGHSIEDPTKRKRKQ